MCLGSPESSPSSVTFLSTVVLDPSPWASGSTGERGCSISTELPCSCPACPWSSSSFSASSSQVPGWMWARYIVPELGSPETSSTTFTPSSLLEHSLHVLYLRLLRVLYGLGELGDLGSIGALEDRLGHRYCSPVVGDHQPQEQHVRHIGGHLAQPVYFLGRGHPWHETARRVAHPRHSGLSTCDRQAPHVQPALHHPYLCLLGEFDVGGQEPHGVALCPVAHDVSHLHSLGVVDHHVAGEACLCRVVAGGRVTSRTAVAPAAQPASRASTRIATSQRRDEEWSLRGVGSMQVFYSSLDKDDGVR